jgi:hypothetical protein
MPWQITRVPHFLPVRQCGRIPAGASRGLQLRGCGSVPIGGAQQNSILRPSVVPEGVGRISYGDRRHSVEPHQMVSAGDRARAELAVRQDTVDHGARLGKQELR